MAHCNARPSRNPVGSGSENGSTPPATALFGVLTFMGGAVWRRRLMDDFGDQGDVTALIESATDVELAELMEISAAIA